MRLSPGVRLGPYEILSALGAGEMGDVYKARDTRLDRSVAIKVLAEGSASDPERRPRFEQDARAVSALNHPHICTLHDIGSSVPSGPDSRSPSPEPRVPNPEPLQYLVMKCVEGETLAHRLEKGPLPDGLRATFVGGGHLLYASGGRLFAVPVDPTLVRLDGDPVPVVEALAHNGPMPLYAASRSGDLAYVAAAPPGPASLVRVDRLGKEQAPPNCLREPRAR